MTPRLPNSMFWCWTHTPLVRYAESPAAWLLDWVPGLWLGGLRNWIFNFNEFKFKHQCVASAFCIGWHGITSCSPLCNFPLHPRKVHSDIQFGKFPWGVTFWNPIDKYITKVVAFSIRQTASLTKYYGLAKCAKSHLF